MSRISILALCSTLSLLAACSSGSSGGGNPSAAIAESEPNDSTATANGLTLARSGHGTVADSTDSDFWSIALTGGEFVSIELAGNRLDQAAWFAADNAPALTVLDTDGTTVLLEQGSDRFSWGLTQDTDVLAFQVPATGTYFVRVDVDDALAAGGDYLLTVTTLTFPAPLQQELEAVGATGANDDDLSAEAIAPGTVLGFHVDNEQDWYTFNVAAPSLVTFTLTTHRSGIFDGDDGYFDPTLQLFDPLLNQFANNDDVYYLDSSIQFVLTTPGDHFIVVDECCGTGDAAYFLEFSLTPLSDLTQVAEVEPNDDPASAQLVNFGEYVSGTVAGGEFDFYSIACNAGDRILVEIFDVDTHEDAADNVDVLIRDSLGTVLPDDTGNTLRTLRTILTQTDSFYVRVTSSNPTDYALRITQLTATFESEPNDTLVDAGSIDTSGDVAGVIDAPGDADLFAFQAVRGVPLTFRCLADGIGPHGYFELDGYGSQLAALLRVRDGAGVVVAESDGVLQNAVGTIDGLPTVVLTFLPPASGTYTLEVVDSTGNSGDDFTYVLGMR